LQYCGHSVYNRYTLYTDREKDNDTETQKARETQKEADWIETEID